MDGFNWINLISQIPVVALFAWVILKIFSKTKEFVESILTKNETFISTILISHTEERARRDNEWRSWLDNQKDYYIEALNNITTALNNLTDRMEDHHKSSMAEAAKIIDLLVKANQNRIRDKEIIEDKEDKEK